MSLMDYVGIGDNFEAEEPSSGLSFPCCVCVHRNGLDTNEPCLTCCYNDNCVYDKEII